MIAFWGVAPCSLAKVDRRFRGAYCLIRAIALIALMVKAVRTSETSVIFCDTTRPFIPEGCHLHTRHRENL
jgi:hypothetical protein